MILYSVTTVSPASKRGLFARKAVPISRRKSVRADPVPIFGMNELHPRIEIAHHHLPRLAPHPFVGGTEILDFAFPLINDPKDVGGILGKFPEEAFALAELFFRLFAFVDWLDDRENIMRAAVTAAHERRRHAGPANAAVFAQVTFFKRVLRDFARDQLRAQLFFFREVVGMGEVPNR